MVSYTHVHGILQLIAFGILFPLGALIAVFREQIGPQWRMWHIAIQLTATALVALAVVAIHMPHTHDTNSKKKQDDPWKRAHKIVGPVVVSLIAIQIVWAFFGKRMITWEAWLRIHMALSASIITLGIINLYIGWKMTR